MIYGIFKTHLAAKKLKNWSLYLYMIVSYMLTSKDVGLSYHCKGENVFIYVY